MTRIPRAYLPLTAAGVLLLTAAGIYLLTSSRNTSRQMMQPLPAVASPSTPVSPAPVAEAPEPSPSTEAVAEMQVAAAPSTPKPGPQPFPPAVLQPLMVRYDQVFHQQTEARERLRTLMDADPELSAVLRAKLDSLQQHLYFITIAQAMDDPVLRPLLLEGWNALVENDSPELRNIYRTGARFDAYGQFKGPPKSRAEIAAFYRAMEPHFQADYQRLLQKMDLSEEIARAYEEHRSNEVLWHCLMGALERRGYTFYVGRPIPPQEQ